MLKLKESEKNERGSETAREGANTLGGYLGPPSGPLAACQYYEHRGAR